MPQSSINNDFIKHMKPRKNSRYHQGYVDPNTCKKLFESCKNEKIIYRSGLELQFINFCEQNPCILKWGSEPICIPYYNRLKKKQCNYYPDYVIMLVKHDKEKKQYVERCIVEIKPYNQTKKPAADASRWLKEAWITNVDKWTAAKEFADKHNMKFIIIHEKFLDGII